MKVLKIILGLFLFLGFSFPVLAEPATAPHWNKNLLMVYMPSDSEYSATMQRAFREWQGNLPSKIQFYTTSSERDKRLVEIDVTFNVLEDAKAKNSGSTVLDGSVNYRHGSIVINAVSNPEIEKDPKLKALNDEEIYAVMLREVGRVLGLPLSSNPQSVMNAEFATGQKILPEDVKSVCEIYGWASQTR